MWDGSVSIMDPGEEEFFAFTQARHCEDPFDQYTREAIASPSIANVSPDFEGSADCATCLAISPPNFTSPTPATARFSPSNWRNHGSAQEHTGEIAAFESPAFAAENLYLRYPPSLPCRDTSGSTLVAEDLVYGLQEEIRVNRSAATPWLHLLSALCKIDADIGLPQGEFPGSKAICSTRSPSSVQELASMLTAGAATSSLLTPKRERGKAVPKLVSDSQVQKFRRKPYTRVGSALGDSASGTRQEGRSA